VADALRCPVCGTTYPDSARFCTNDGTALVASVSADPLVGTRLDGRYLVLKKLGEGGMGAVYEGVQLSIDRQVAIKVIRAVGKITQRQRQRLWLEARAVSRLEHPNVVRVYDYGTGRDDAPFIVMELLRGRALSDAMNAQLPLDPDRARWVVAEAARGLAAAHRQGLVHRDIKPNNLWLQDEDDERSARVKVLDFGLVTGGGDDDRITHTGDVVGTPSYMCPEQIEGRTDITAAADVYALGVLLYELCVGRLPFGGNSFVDILSAQLMDPIPDTRNAINGVAVPADLRAVWTRAMAKAPEARYADAGAMLDELMGSRVPQMTPLPGTLNQLPDDIAALPTQDVTVAAAEASIRRSVVRRTHASAGTRERKRVTVLSVTLADVADELDLEDRIELAGDLIDSWAARVEASGGSVEVLEGVGLRATWGLPIAGEGDAKAALDCSLAVAGEGRELAGELAVRIAIHTDSMLAELDAQSPSGYRLVGDPWRVAEEAADVGAPAGGMPVLTGRAYRTLRRVFTRDLPEVGEVKGDSLYRVQGGASALVSMDLSMDISPGSRTVGRDREIARACLWVAESVKRRRAALHIVVGEPGIGKSRLLVEVGRRLKEQHPELRVLPASSDDRDEAPYGVFRRLLLAASGGTTQAATTRLERWITSTMSQRASTVGQGPARDIVTLLGLSGDTLDDAAGSPQGRRARGFNAIVDLCASLAVGGGLLLLLDDFHAGDTESMELIDFILGELSDFPITILGFGRPEDSLTARYAPELEVGPLPGRAAGALARDLSRSRLSSDAVDQVVERAAGNPLFLEELIRAAADRPAGSDPRELPDSLHAMLRARFDAQPDSVRSVLQHAAVVGTTFWSGAVEAQVPDGTLTRRPISEVLTDVRRSGFAKRTASSLFEGDHEWVFAQSMMRDVAYEANLRRDRKQGHRAVATWLLARGGDLQPVHFPVIADHLERAGDTSDAARAWRRAGDSARERHANAPAAKAYGRALELQSDWASADVLALKLDLGKALQQLGRAEQAEEQLNAVADHLDADATQQTDALIYLARIAGPAGRTDERMELLKHARAVSKGAERRSVLQLAGDMAFALIMGGDQAGASEVMEEALASAMGAQDGHDRLTALGNLHVVRAILARHRGDLAAAETSIRDSAASFHKADNARGTASSHNSLSICLRDLGRHDEAAASARLAAQLFKEQGLAVYELTARLNLGWSRLEGGYPLRALQAFQRLREDLGDCMTWMHKVLADAGEGLAAHHLELHDTATKLGRRCLDTAEQGDSEEALGWAHHAAGVILSDPKLLRAAVQTWRKLPRPAWLLRTLRALADHAEPPEKANLTAEITNLEARLAGITTKP
jgi:serine/threonine protein kinase/tetratricopeptide (TPR) repeat protein